jgi:two-component sensor histidine kinase
MSHRVKNSLAVVVGLLRVQALSAQSEDAQSALADAGSRVATIAQVHDHLWRGTQIGFVELADFMGELCNKLQEAAPGHTVLCHADRTRLSADQAIPLGLLVNELVTNAVKYAYPDRADAIQVSAREIGGRLQVEVSDQGIGLPEGFDIDQPRKSLGLRLIDGLLRQLNGQLKIASNEPKGSRFTLEMPLLSKASTPLPLSNSTSAEMATARPGNTPCTTPAYRT